MAFAFKYQYYVFLCIMWLIFPILCYSEMGFVTSRATYYGSPDSFGTPTGACGYGDYGSTVNYGVVAGVSRLYKNGIGCGACYKVRCTAPGLCEEDGVRALVTDYGEGDNTDFILSPRGYTGLARPNMASELLAHGVVDVEYMRVPCEYSSASALKLKVHEKSQYAEYLAVVFLYTSGLFDILEFDIWEEECQQWVGMRRAYGAVFDISKPPKGALQFRVKVRGPYGVQWVQSKNALPGDWKAGTVYDIAFPLA